MMTNSFFSATSILCFGLPVAVIVFYQLYRHVSLIALTVYYTLTILRCIGSSSVPPVPNFSDSSEVLFHYLEVPLILFSLLFFCPARQRQQKIQLLIGLFTVYEIIIAAVFGFTPTASLYIMAPGLLVIVLYALFLFLRQASFTIMHGKNTGRVLMLGALLFSYSCYLAMFYAFFVLSKPDVSGIYALHFLSSGIAAIIMSVGLFMMRYRIRELQELKVTRKELQMVFGS